MLNESTKRILCNEEEERDRMTPFLKEVKRLRNMGASERKNEMEATKTHEVLDEAKRLVEDAYRFNATIKKPDESGKWHPESSDGIVVSRGESILKP